MVLTKTVGQIVRVFDMGCARGRVGIDLSSARTADRSYYAVESEADTVVDVARAMGGAVLYLFKRS